MNSEVNVIQPHYEVLLLNRVFTNKVNVRIYLPSLTESSPSIADIFFEKIYVQK